MFEKFTALFLACREGRLNMVEMLIAAGNFHSEIHILAVLVPWYYIYLHNIVQLLLFVFVWENKMVFGSCT